MEEEEEEAVGRAVIAEIRAKRNDADAGKRVRREKERSGKIFFIWSRHRDRGREPKCPLDWCAQFQSPLSRGVSFGTKI